MEQSDNGLMDNGTTSLLLLCIFGRLTALGGSVLLVPPQLDARHLVVELSELVVLLDVGRRLVRKRTDELSDLQRPRGHSFAHLHQSSLRHYFVDCLFELNKEKGTFPPV